MAREVAEEVGISVRDIRYVASQPHPFPASLMLGFTAVLDGDDTLVIDHTEIAEAGWFTRDEVGRAVDWGDEGSAEAPPEDTDRSAPGRHPGRAKPRDPSGDLKSEKAGKKPDDNAGNGASAREIPDGSDDDVVARRLRQAAQQETDPELKEKLWQEYIDYKKNAQGK